ncbi:MAG: hypothetical protein M3214_13055 [Actinomycetota bacterium]|nr:hypothetical protein [Actinomycetota bacterium]
MIERDMVRRMILRGLVLAPVLVAALWLWRGPTYGWSGAVGLGLTLANLWLSARIIGGVAETSPQLLMPAALATFALGLLLLTGAAFALEAADLVFFPVTGFVLIVSHLGLVLWEAAGAYGHVERVRS